MIEVSNLVKFYGDKRALGGISFTVNQGEILGFLGPNGAGKTTTMNIITGYLSATSGKVTINGYDILEQPELAKKNIGYLPELPPLFLDMTVYEYLEYVSELKKVSRDVRKKQIANVMQMVHIGNVSGRLIHNLSKGYRQRVGIAQTLIGNPEVIILDEPTVGLDPNQVIEIRKLIASLAQNHTIIFSSHILSEVQAICDRVIIINNGKIAADAPTIELSAQMQGSSHYLVTVEGSFSNVQMPLRAVPGIKSVTALSEKNGILQMDVMADGSLDVRKSIFYTLARMSAPILEFKSMAPSLEDVFADITSARK
ncbi:MAG: ATP-binding cassette domain-containing protein [Clostridiales bacterium]|nr:ATP-binding cassette domain-containing protein [Clostridiales bacterium]